MIILPTDIFCKKLYQFANADQGCYCVEQVVWESEQFIGQMQSALKTTWTLVQLSEATPPATLAQAVAAVGEVPLQLLDSMPALRLYQSLGYASPLVDEPLGRPEPLPPSVKFCGGGAPGLANGSRIMAEWTFAAALELVFKLEWTDRQMRACAWMDGAKNSCPYYSQFGAHRTLSSMTLGIIGYGKIGSELGALAAPAFKSIIAGDPKAATNPHPPAPLLSWSSNNTEVYRQADVIALTFADHSAATAGLVDQHAFAAMKPGAYVVAFVGDVGIDERAAFNALHSGHLGGMAVHQWWEQWRWRPPHGFGRSPHSPSPTPECRRALLAACAAAKRASKGNCYACVGSHQQQLQQAGCGQSDIDSYCSDSETMGDELQLLSTEKKDAVAKDASSQAKSQQLGEWTSPSGLGLPWDSLENVLMSPNAAEKSLEYWRRAAILAANRLDSLAGTSPGHTAEC